MNKHKQAFTLVELIVVLTIIAILGTIAFITMQGYSASSRDSVRISDMSKISSSLELFNIDAGKYPDPTQAQPVTYSGGLAWYQGIFGNATFTNVSRLDKIPTDPLTDKEYAYSLLSTKQEFEIGSIIEGNDLVYSPHLNLNANQPHPLLRGEGIYGILETTAAEKTAKAKITGTYNGVSLRVNANNTSYILAIPSILTSIDLEVETNRGLEVIIPANELVLDNYSNLPSNYVGTSYDSNKETTNPDFKIVNNILVYEGDIKNLTPTILITKLQEAYSGTTVAQTHATSELFQIDVASGLQLERIDNYGKNFINNNLGGTAESRIYNTCGGVAHNTMKSYYSEPSVLFGETCDTVKKDFICIDGTWTDTLTSANILDYPETECIVEDALNCTYLETPINHGDSITVYSQETLVWNGEPNCSDAGIQGTVTCNNGVNEGDATFAYKTCTKGTPTNCTADSSYEINGHTYNVIQMNHDVSSTPTVDVSESNGIFRYTFNALCNDGTITGNETGPVIQSCNTGYYNNGGISCEQQWSGNATTGYLFKNTSAIEQYPLSCNDLLIKTIWKNTYVGSPWNGTKFNDGIYWVKPDTNPAFQVYCDMTTDGGGWTRTHVLRYINLSSNYWTTHGYTGIKIDTADKMWNSVLDGTDNTYLRPLKRFGYTKWAWLTDANYNNINTLNTLATYKSNGNSSNLNTWLNYRYNGKDLMGVRPDFSIYAGAISGGTLNVLSENNCTPYSPMVRGWRGNNHVGVELLTSVNAGGNCNRQKTLGMPFEFSIVGGGFPGVNVSGRPVDYIYADTSMWHSLWIK